MPNELAIKLSFINDMLDKVIDDYTMTDTVLSKLIAAKNSLYEAEQSITSMVNWYGYYR